jgi:hypothetical protein
MRIFRYAPHISQRFFRSITEVLVIISSFFHRLKVVLSLQSNSLGKSVFTLTDTENFSKF